SSNKLDYATSLNRTASGSTSINWTGSEEAPDCVESYSQENQILAARIASAEDAPVQNSDGESSLNKDLTSGAKLEEVVVTAQKRAEDLQRVPISVQVINSQTLAEQNYNTLRDLSQIVPSLHIETGFAGNLFIRGIGSGVGGGNPSYDQSVAMFTDDI